MLKEKIEQLKVGDLKENIKKRGLVPKVNEGDIHSKFCMIARRRKFTQQEYECARQISREHELVGALGKYQMCVRARE